MDESSETSRANDGEVSWAVRPSEGLTGIATRRPIGVLMVVLTAATFGLISFQRLPRNLMPDVAYPSVTVRTDYPGASPRE